MRPGRFIRGPDQCLVRRRRSVHTDDDSTSAFRRAVGGDHDDRARSVGDAALADRSEEQSGEPAAATRPDDEHLSTPSGVHEGNGGVLHQERLADLAEPRYLTVHPVHGGGQQRPRRLLQRCAVVEQVVGRHRIGRQPAVHHLQRRLMPTGLLGRPPQRPGGMLRPVGAGDDPRSAGSLLGHGLIIGPPTRSSPGSLVPCDG